MSFLLLCFSSAKSPLTSTLSFPLQTFLLHTFLLDIFLLNTFPRLVRSQFRSIPHQSVHPSGSYRRINRCHSDVHNGYCFFARATTAASVYSGVDGEGISSTVERVGNYSVVENVSPRTLLWYCGFIRELLVTHVLCKVQLHACIT